MNELDRLVETGLAKRICGRKIELSGRDSKWGSGLGRKGWALNDRIWSGRRLIGCLCGVLGTCGQYQDGSGRDRSKCDESSSPVWNHWVVLILARSSCGVPSIVRPEIQPRTASLARSFLWPRTYVPHSTFRSTLSSALAWDCPPQDASLIRKMREHPVFMPGGTIRDQVPRAEISQGGT